MAEVRPADNSVEAMKTRLAALQKPLGKIVTKASDLFAEVFPHAPHPADAPKDFPVYATSSMNAEPSHELTIRLPGRKVVRIDKHPLSATPTYPLRRVWFWRPEAEGLRRRVEVLELAGRRAEEGLPYEIETSIWTDTKVNSTIREFIGPGYHDQEPSIEETSQALGDAETVALQALGITPVSRLRAQQAIISSETFWGIGIGAPGGLQHEP